MNDTFTPPVVCRHKISVFAPETVIPNGENAVTITVIIFSSPFDDRDTYDARIVRVQQTTQSLHLLPFLLPSPVNFFSACSAIRLPLSPFRWTCTMLSVMDASARKRFLTSRSTAVKNLLNSGGASTHPCLRPCPASNLSEHSPSSDRTHACKMSRNWRMTASIFGGTPTWARTSHRRVRSTESYALVRSIKHKYKGVSFFRAGYCSRRTTNIMSTVERCRLHSHCSSGRMFSRSQQSLRRAAITLKSTLTA